MPLTHSQAGKLGSAKAAPIIAAAKQQRRKAYYANPILCANPKCQKPIPYEKKRRCKYCNHSCAAQVVNQGQVRTTPHKCLVCPTSIKGKTKFCSTDCYFTSYRQKQLDKTKQHPEQVSEAAVRRYLAKTTPHQCQVCGRRKWLGKPIPLEVDHIDGNSTNREWSNVRRICPNCHAQTPTFKSKNKGNGRHSRRIRYREGKSY